MKGQTQTEAFQATLCRVMCAVEFISAGVIWQCVQAVLLTDEHMHVEK